MRLERPLDLGGRDVLATADDDVLEPPDDAHPALAVHGRKIAGAEPPAGRDDGGCLRLVGIAGEHLGSTDPEFARVAHAAVLPRLGVRHAQLHLPHGPPVGVARLLERVVVWLVVTVGASVDP